MTSRVVSPVSENTERSILEVAPEHEGLDWICYRVRGGVDPAAEQLEPPRSFAPAELSRPRPEREDIARALGRLVSLGMLTYDGRRWSMTSKGYAKT